MDLISVLLIALIVLVIYLAVRWILKKFKIDFDNDILVVGAIIIFILAILGRINLGV